MMGRKDLREWQDVLVIASMPRSYKIPPSMALVSIAGALPGSAC